MALDPSFDLVKSVAGLLDKHYLGARYPSALPGGVPAEANNAFSHLYITAPFGGRQQLAKLFSSHPPIDERIERLEELAREMGEQGRGPDAPPAWPGA